MNIVKVGGSTLRTASDFEQLVLRLRRDHARPVVVVVSALPLVTRQLEQAAMLAERGDDDAAHALLADVIAHHRTMAQHLLSNQETLAALDTLFNELCEQTLGALRGTRLTGELTPRTLDRITSIGERMALHLIAHVLQERGLAISTVPATELIVTDAAFGNAQPLDQPTAERVQRRLLPLLNSGAVVVTEGYVGMAYDGSGVTTMGKESSNLTAALLARMIGADELVLYTPVAGIHTADPLLVPGARPIAHLSYDHADELAHAGLKLLYPTMIAPLRQQNIPLRIAALDTTASPSTRIGSTCQTPQTFVLIAEPLSAIELDRSGYRAALEHRWQHHGIAVERGAAVLVAATAGELNTLEHEGIPIRYRSDCWQLRVWVHAADAAVHRRIRAMIAEQSAVEALTAIHAGDTSTVTALILTDELLPLAVLHEQIAQEFPDGQGVSHPTSGQAKDSRYRQSQ